MANKFKKQREYIGYDSIKKLCKELEKNKSKNIFLVSGKKSYETCGAKDKLSRLLKGYKVMQFTEFDVNPKIEDVEKGIDFFKDGDFDTVMAVGGGSAMDVAKAINIFSTQAGKPVEYIKKEKTITNRGKFLIAIPTTSGTGSEATHFAVIYVNKTKYSLAHPFILPDVSIVDPQFTVNLPEKITASTAMDALSQAIESFWSVNSTDESKGYAQQAIRLLLPNMVKVVNNPSEASREAVAEAAHMAGKAINITLTTAPHAISYPITSYFNIPHGHAVGLTLSSMLVYNSQVTDNDALDARGAYYVKKTINQLVNILNCTDVDQTKKLIDSLMTRMNLKIKFSEIGIKSKEDREIIIKNGFNPDRVKNNPRRLTEESLRNILDVL